MNNTIFEEIKKFNEHDSEYWSAREMAKILEYSEYRFFLPVIEKAKISCKKSGNNIDDHFEDMHEMVEIGSGAQRALRNVYLSRYACYLIVQNADPSKEIVALGQTYFATQTRRQELLQDLLMEDNSRVVLRGEITVRNKKLAKAAREARVVRYGNFQDYGYMGLYAGMRQKDIHAKKKLKKNEKILDYMGSEELAANLFRATQAHAKLRRENIMGEDKANQAHYDVGKKVRQTIQDLGGTMPEKLPTPDHVGKAQRRLRQSEHRQLVESASF